VAAKRPRTLPCSVEVKNEWSCTSAPLICLRSLARDGFTFYTNKRLFQSGYSKADHAVYDSANAVATNIFSFGPTFLLGSRRSHCPGFEITHSETHHNQWDSSGRRIGSTQRPLPDNTQHSRKTDIHAPCGI
jgi:hypothetical protein